MTISSTSRTAGPFVGNGVATTFPFAFKVFARADVLVALTVTATGIETIKTLDSDFTIALNADQNSNPGGMITMAVAPPVGVTLAATSNIAITQSLDLTNNGGFYPKTINDALDRIVIMIQQVGTRVGLGMNVGASAAVATVLGFIGQLAANAGAALVGFLQAGLGAIARTVLDKLRETVSIADFGAVGDGVTDDTAAIQAAINYVCTAGKPKKLLVPCGKTGVYLTRGALFINTGGITIEWENNNIAVRKGANGAVFVVNAGMVKFVNPGIDGNGANGFTGSGIYFNDASYFTFDGVIQNAHIFDTLDSCVMFKGPRGGLGTLITGGSLVPYNPGGLSGAGPAAIRLFGPADTDATPRKITDVESSSAPLIDLTGMVTTFIKGGQCATILFAGNPDVTGAGGFLSAKAIITGVRIRDGIWIRGQDHTFSACVSHGYAPQYSSYGVLAAPLTVGWRFSGDSQNCQADSSNLVINKIDDLTNGLGDATNTFFCVDQGYALQWGGSVAAPTIGNGTIAATYNVSGAMVDVSVFINIGSTTTFGSGFWTFSLPYRISGATWRGWGGGRSHNAGVADELGMAFENSRGLPSNVTLASVATGNNFSATVPHAWKAGDFIELSFRYLRG